MKRHVLITGGASGIGLATAKLFSRDHHVTIVDTQEAPGFEVCKADVRDPERAREIVESLPRLDALITCAGVSIDAPLDALTPAQWRDVIDIDLTGTFNYLHAAAPVFKAQQSGRIVTIASTVALRARKHLANYIAAKAGVIGLTRAAARDLGRHNVNVNSVAPGVVETPLSRKIPIEVKHRLTEETALGRLAEPEDIAAVIHFLCSDAARHITGEVIRVDGGQLA